jgi:hypothetical protein
MSEYSCLGLAIATASAMREQNFDIDQIPTKNNVRRSVEQASENQQNSIALYVFNH